MIEAQYFSMFDRRKCKYLLQNYFPGNKGWFGKAVDILKSKVNKEINDVEPPCRSSGIIVPSASGLPAASNKDKPGICKHVCIIFEINCS